MINSCNYMALNLSKPFYYLSPTIQKVTSRVWECALATWSILTEVPYGVCHAKQLYQHCQENRIIALPKEVRKVWNVRKGDTVLVTGIAETCKPIYRRNASQTLKEHLELAETIFQYVNSKVPHSPNYESRTYGTLRESFGQYKNRSENFRPWFQASNLEDWAERIEKVGAGVCEELAAVGQEYARKNFSQYRVEMAGILTRRLGGIEIGHGCHTFLVIGRKADSDACDYTTWGRDDGVVILDIWAGKYYPLSAVEDEMYDYLTTVKQVVSEEENAEGFSLISCPYVRPFNPYRQALVCYDQFHDNIEEIFKKLDPVEPYAKVLATYGAAGLYKIFNQFHKVFPSP